MLLFVVTETTDDLQSGPHSTLAVLLVELLTNGLADFADFTVFIRPNLTGRYRIGGIAWIVALIISALANRPFWDALSCRLKREEMPFGFWNPTMRKLLLPALLAAGIGLPFLISNSNKNNNARLNQNSAYNVNGQVNYGMPARQASTGFTQPPTQLASYPNGVANQTVPPGIPAQFASTPVPPALLAPPAGGTIILPGTANGPDLTAAPMEFLPTTNLAEIFRFDVFPDWVKNRWPRVSTAPTEPGLHGLRVALVTGTNPNDLSGSLTYHFDVNQRLQRISFQGWTGDTARLVDLVTKSYGFRSQPTHFAGFYASGTRRAAKGALILRNPTVVRAGNPNQQVAVVLEVNNPQGSFTLSQSMLEKIKSAVDNR